jgi:hypothetical protein
MKPILAACIFLPLLLSVTAVPASAATRPAVAAVTCSGNGCDGLSPGTTGCAATAITAKSVNLYRGSELLGIVQLRYSTACRTVWGRIVNYVSTVGAALVHRNFDGRVEQCNSLTYSSTLGAYSCYTLQLYDGGVTSYAGGSVVLDGGFYGGDTGNY